MNTSPCDGCISGCCRNYHLVVSGYDVFRIATTLKLPTEDFAELRWLDRPEGDYQIRLSAAPDAEERHHRLVLRRVPDGPEGGAGQRCSFLLTVGSRGRCGIYGIRPGVCRTYPSSFADGLIGVSAGGKYCPPGAWQVEAIDVPLFRLNHRRRARQSVIHAALVAAWNRRIVDGQLTETERYFFHYLLSVYHDLAKRDPSLFDESDADRSPEDLERTVAETVRTLGWAA